MPPLPESVRLAVARATGGGAPAPTSPPPEETHRPTITKDSDPVLSRHGITVPMSDFNRRVAAAVEAGRRANGYDPTPGLILDLSRAPVHEQFFPGLFSAVPSSRRVAGARKALANPVQATPADVFATTSEGIRTTLDWWGPEPIPDKDVKARAEEIAERWKAGDLSWGELQQTVMADPRLQREVDRLLDDAMPTSVNPGVTSALPVDPKLAAPNAESGRQYQEALAYSLERYGDLNRADLKRMGVYIPEGPLRAFEQGGEFVAAGIFGADRDNLLARTAYQIGVAATQMPFGMYALGQATVLDVKDAVTEGDLTPDRLGGIAKVSIQSTIDDFKHPLENPGYLVLDVFGLVSGAFGAGARVGAAAKGAKAATSVPRAAGAVAKGLLTRPLPGQAVVAGEFVNLSENALARAVQRIYYGAADRAISRRTGPNGVPYGGSTFAGYTLNTPGVMTLDRARRRFFSFEQTYSRAVQARLRATVTEAAHRADEVRRLANGAAKAGKTFDRMLQDPSWSAWFTRQKTQTRVGVQKAIQVIAGDIDPDPMRAIELERAYHRSIIDDPRVSAAIAKKAGLDQDSIVRNHRAQLLALDEAEKVLRANSPEFQTALAETRALSQMTEALRTGLGLEEDVAVGSIARYGQVIRGEQILDADGNVIPAGPISPDSFYFPRQRAQTSKKAPSFQRGTTVGPYGLVEPNLRRDVPELYHRFEGDSLQIGDYRIDTAALTADQYGKTVRAVTVRDNYDRLWDLSTDKPGPNSFVIRDVRDMPDEIKARFQRMDDGVWDGADADWARDATHKELLDTLFPGRWVKGRLVDVDGKPLDLKSGNFRYVDERFIFDRPGSTHVLHEIDKMLSGKGDSAVGQIAGGTLNAYNEVVRATTLFLRPGYALNAAGNGAMLMVQQGFLAPVSLGRAMTAKVRYGDDVARWLDTLAGESRTQSLVTNRSVVTKGSQGLSKAWSVVTDRAFRRAAVIHELRRQGITSPDDLRTAMKATDPDSVRTVREASKRAKRAMVEFDNLNPFERSVLRHVIFIYAWWSRSAVWSARFLMDHPIQAATLAQVGRASEEEMDALLGQVPESFKRMQMFLTGQDEDGDPTARGLTWLLPTTGLNEMSRPFLGLMEGQRPGKQALVDSFGPGATLLSRVVTGRDQFGQEYETGPVRGALEEAVRGTPIGAVMRRQEQAEDAVPAPEVDPTNRRTFLTRENAAAERPTFKPPASTWEALEPLLVPAAERSLDQEALNAKYWRDLAKTDPEAWHKHQMDVIRQGMDLQAGILKEPLPTDVKLAANYMDEFSWRLTQAEKENGPAQTTARERAGLKIQVMLDLGLIDDSEADELRAEVAKAKDGPQMRRAVKALDLQAGGDALAEWNARVRTVVQFRDQATIDETVANLTRAGAGDYTQTLTSSPDQRDEYGRRFTSFMEEYNARLDQIEDPELPQEEQDRLRREFRDWLVEQDEAVDVAGTAFPSFERMRWARLSPQQQQDDLVDLAKAGANRLTAFDRTLLGIPADPMLPQAWQAFEEQVANDRAQLDAPEWEGKRKPTVQQIERQRAAWIEQAVPGFEEDWRLDRGPRLRWLERMRQFKESRFNAEWAELFALAGTYATAVEEIDAKTEAGETSTLPKWKVLKVWREYVAEFYGTLPKDFQAEANDYGGLDWIASWLS